MKALSLWQPWATLIAIGAKQWETRSWNTQYRGDVLIHASKNESALDVCSQSPFCAALVAAGYPNARRDLPRGKALCVAELVAVLTTEEVRGSISTMERDFGNYANGRYAWKFENIRRLIHPFDLRGQQGLWELDEAALILVQAQLAAKETVKHG